MKAAKAESDKQVAEAKDREKKAEVEKAEAAT